MPQFLHMTKCSKWIVTDAPWLASGEIPAYPLFGLHVQSESQMSAWEIDEDVRVFEEFAAGLAAGREGLQNFDYVLIDLATLTEIGIRAERKPGISCDSKIINLHWELTEISAQKAVKLVGIIRRQLEDDDSRVDRILKKEVAQKIWVGIQEGRIDSEKMLPRVLNGVKAAVGE